MDNLDLAQLRALHAAATPGEWEGGLHYLHKEGDEFGDYSELTNGKQTLVGLFPRYDVEFCAAIHNAFPAILDRLEAAERERDNALRYTDLLISERDKLKKIAVELIASFASVRGRNTPEWMEGITDDINAALESLGDDDRVELKHGMLLITQAARLRLEAGE